MNANGLIPGALHPSVNGSCDPLDVTYHIVIADDQSVTRTILTEVVRGASERTEVLAFGDGASALEVMAEGTVDLLLTDFKMPGLNGLELIEAVRRTPACAEVPVIMVSCIGDGDLRRRALMAGCNEFLTKPIDPTECLIRCRNLLRLRQVQRMLAWRIEALTTQQHASARQAAQLEADAALRLGLLGARHRDGARGHILRVGAYAERIARRLGLGAARAAMIGSAAQLHDLGMVDMPAALLQQPGPLSPAQWEQVKTHPQAGYDRLVDSPSPLLQLGATIALGHHERSDGRGYPAGLAGEAIPLEARIVAVADVFATLCAPRPYAEVWAPLAALSYLNSQRGRRFDTDCVDAFLADAPEIIETAHV
jgi:two-component system response regulator RpfG